MHRASKLLILFFLLNLALQVSAKIHNFSCEELENSQGIIVKFKKNNGFRLFNKNFIAEDFSDSQNATKYLERKLKRKIKKTKKVFINSKKNFSKHHHFNKFKNRAIKFQQLSEIHNLDQIYLIETNFPKQSPSFTTIINVLSNQGITNSSSINTCNNYQNLLTDLNSDANIEFAEPNIQVSLNSTNDPFYNSSGSWSQNYDDMWALKRIKADDAWSLSQGEGMIVAIVDTGVDYNHPDLWNNIWVNPEFASDRNNDGDIDLDDLDINADKSISNSEIITEALGFNFVSFNKNPIDGHGHGTHVAGTVAAIRNNAIGIVGIAPKAKIMPIKGLNDSGSGYISDLADAVVYAAQYADIANHSWGGSGYTQLLDHAFQIAYDLGMVNIAAAGNDSMDAADFYPAALDTAITVGSSSQIDYRSSFSNYGSVVDVYAPGGGDNTSGSTRNILSTMSSLKNLGNTVSTGYSRLAGTSMAAPHVAGVAALLKAKNPNLNQEQIRTIITNTTSPGASSISTPTGIVDAYAATILSEPLPEARLIFADSIISGLVDIKAIAKGENFTNFTIDYASGSHDRNSLGVAWQNLVNSSNPAFNEIVYEDFDSSLVTDGYITFRLTVFDDDGNSSQDFVVLSVDNLKLKSPIIDVPEYNQAAFGSNIKIPIKGTVFSASLNNYSILVKDVNNQELAIDGLVSLVDAGTKNVNNGLLAEIDSSKLPGTGYYKYLLKINTGLGLTQLIGDFVYDSAIHRSWPKEMLHEKPQWLCSGSICSRTQNIFWQNFKLSDIDNDGDLEIFQSYTETRFYNENGVIDNWDRDDIYFYPTGHIADLDGNGKKEIFGINRAALDYLTIIDNKGDLIGVATNLGQFGNSIMIASDLDADNKKEIAIIANRNFGTELLITDKDFNTKFSSPYRLFNQYNFSNIDPIIIDIDNDGNKELVFYYENVDQSDNRILIIDPKTGTVLKNWNVDLISNSLITCDLDNDGDFEIIFYNASENILYAHHHDATLVTGFPVELDGNVLDESPLAIGDLNKDHKPEIVLAYKKYDAVLNELKYFLSAIQADGVELEAYPLVTTIDTRSGSEYIKFDLGAGLGTPLIVDINNDGFNEIIVSKGPLKSSRVVIKAFDYQGQQVNNFEFFAEKGFLFPNNNSIAIGDVDGDNLLELVYADFDYDLYLYDLNIPATNNIAWASFDGIPEPVYTAPTTPPTPPAPTPTAPTPTPPSPAPVPIPAPPPSAPTPAPPSPIPAPKPTKPEPEEPEIPEEKPITPFKPEESKEEIFGKSSDQALNNKDISNGFLDFNKEKNNSNSNNKFDLNKDGKIDDEDFILLEDLMKENPQYQIIIEATSTVDQNSDFNLSPKEFTKTTNLLQNAIKSFKKKGSIIKKYENLDLNQDGKINQDDKIFLNSLKK